MNDHLRGLLAGYVDGELTEEERIRFEEALASDPSLRAELDEFRKLKEVTSMMNYADLPLEVWDTYWESIYRKLERGIGWVVFSLSAIGLLFFGAWQLLSELWTDPAAPLWIKLGVTGVAAGSSILLVSYGRERFFAFKRDRYSEVQR